MLVGQLVSWDHSFSSLLCPDQELSIARFIFLPIGVHDLSLSSASTKFGLRKSLGGYTEHEELYSHGVLRYERVLDHSEPNILWLIVTKDEKSWGRNGDNPPRSFKSFLQQVANTSLPLEKISLGVLTSSEEEYKNYRTLVEGSGLARVVVYFHSGYVEAPVNRDNRHDGELQKARRGEIAKIRNYLMLRTLREEKHIVWTDADVMELSPNIIQTMIAHSEDRKDAGIITARCALGGMANYDLNAWSGTRTGPDGWELKDEKLNEAEQEALGQHHVEELIKDTNDNDLIELNTVGGTILYMRAELVWQGLSFPHQYVVGTRWISEGWDGIESEGLCYRARDLTGGKCWVLGGSHHVEHTTD